MKMCRTLDKYFFADREARKADRLCLCFAEDGVLVLNGERRYPCRDGIVLLPAEDLQEGENLLFFRTARRGFPCESLCKEGDLVSPRGLPTEEWLTDLLLRTEALAKRLQAAEERLATLEKKGASSRLFGGQTNQ